MSEEVKWYDRPDKKFTNEDQYRKTTAAHGSKQWMRPEVLDNIYEKVRNTRSGLAIYKNKYSTAAHTQDKYTLKCEDHGTFAPFTWGNIEPIHHVSKRIGRGEDPHFCESCKGESG